MDAQKLTTFLAQPEVAALVQKLLAHWAYNPTEDGDATEFFLTQLFQTITDNMANAARAEEVQKLNDEIEEMESRISQVLDGLLDDELLS